MTRAQFAWLAAIVIITSVGTTVWQTSVLAAIGNARLATTTDNGRMLREILIRMPGR